MESLVNSLVDLFSGLNKDVVVFIISMLPLLELRGGLLAASILNVSFLPGYILSILGNVLPIPFLLLFLEKILNWLGKFKSTKKIVNKFEKKVLSKKDQIDKYGYIALMLFVGIPLPGTGAWTGTLAASLLNMDFKKSTLSVMGGVILAGIIMGILSLGVFQGLLG